MAEGTLTTQAWEERETLRHDLANARREITCASDSLKHALNPKERARDFVRDRPLAAALTTLALGLVASRLLPVLLWRSKGSLFKRFTGELMKGAAGIALPILTSRLSGKMKARRDPNTIVFTGRGDAILP